MDSMFNTPQEVVQANMNGAVKKATTSKKKVFFMGIIDRKSTRLNSSHSAKSRMPSSA